MLPIPTLVLTRSGTKGFSSLGLKSQTVLTVTPWIA